MKLYRIKAEAWSSVFGTPDNPNYGGSSNDCTSVAQKPDCSAFLFLTHTTQDDLEGLTLLDSIPLLLFVLLLLSKISSKTTCCFL